MRRLSAAAVLIACLAAAFVLFADSTAQTLPFSQNWADTGLITVNDDWSGVPGIVGFRGDGLATVNRDPQTVLADDVPVPVVDVTANQANPNTFGTGGVAEFAIADPVVALQGSGTADAPYLLIHLNTTGACGINVSYNVRDIDGSADNAVQQVALHYRVGATGDFTNVPAAYIADATTGPSLATLVTPVSVSLPAAVNSQSQVFLRIMTVDATGADEWVGIDDINITGGSCTTPALSINDVSLNEGDAGTTNFTFTVNVTPAAPLPVTFDIATSPGTASAGSDYTATSLTAQTIPAGSSTYTFTVPVTADTVAEPNETFTVDVTNVSGAAVSDAQGAGTIVNDDIALIALTGAPYTQNFDALANAGTSSTTPTGWYFSETGSGANALYTAGNGSGTTGDTYSLGATGSSDRAFGGLQSTSTTPRIGALFRNDTGAPITNLRITYTGEQWRFGTLGRSDRLDFQFSTDATSLTTGTWSNVDPLDFSAPQQATAGAVDGTAAANRLQRNYTIAGLSVPAGGQIWIRWNDFGATGADDALGVDDFTIETNVAATTLTIPQIQGAGTATPYDAQLVQTTGVVTALKTNGFFMQTAAADADPNTSEAIFVFTNVAPAVAPGDVVSVTGTATEYFTLTQITNATVAVTATGTVPVPVALTPAILNPANTFEQNLERYEGMLVTGTLTSVTPTDDFNETWTVLTGTPRPFREPGIPVSDPLPPGAPNAPRFDENTERILVDSDGIAGVAPAYFPSNANVGTVTGPLDFAFGDYKVLPIAPLTSVDADAVPVREGTADELTIASFNIENFGPALGAGDYVSKLEKGSLVIRNVLRYPDIIGMVEVQDQASLDALVARVNADAAAIDGRTPAYVGYVIESDGNSNNSDQDVGFIVKSSRVTGASVQQGLSGGVRATFTDPRDGSTDTLNDREPLILRASVQRSPADPVYPVTVIVNHLRSLIDVEDAAEGLYARTKRDLQAEYLANLVQSLRVSEPNLILVGDFNAFQFNDGWVDVIAAVKGTPTPDDQVDLTSPDLVDPDLIDLITGLPAAEQYTFTFEGNPQVLDHIIVTPEVAARVVEFDIARNNADYPEAYRPIVTRPTRISDHDIPVVFLALPALPAVSIADAAATEGDAGTTPMTFTLTLSAPSASPVTVTWSTADGAAIAGSDFTASSGTVTFAPGVVSQTVTVPVIGDFAIEPLETFTVSLSSPAGAVLGDGSATGTIADNDAPVDLAITKTAVGTTFYAGAPITFRIDVTNLGSVAASNVTVTDILPPGLTFVSATTADGTCSGTSSVVCNLGVRPAGSTASVLLTATASSTATSLVNTATVASDQTDSIAANNSSTVTLALNDVTEIPTLSEWMLIALAMALAAVAALRLRL